MRKNRSQKQIAHFLQCEKCNPNRQRLRFPPACGCMPLFGTAHCRISPVFRVNLAANDGFGTVFSRCSARIFRRVFPSFSANSAAIF